MNDRTRAYILKQTDYKESDAMVSVLTEDFGILTLIAKGVRKQGSKNIAALYPFSLSEILFDYAENKDLFVLHSARLIHNDSRIHEDLISISFCNVIAELLLLLKQDSTESYAREYLWKLCDKIIPEIAEKKDSELAFSFFLARILELAGISPEVDECAICGNSRIQAVSVEAGGFVCENCAGGIRHDVELLRQFRLLNKAGIEHYDILKPFGPFRKENSELLYDFLRSYLSVDLKSWKFLQEVLSQGF